MPTADLRHVINRRLNRLRMLNVIELGKEIKPMMLFKEEIRFGRHHGMLRSKISHASHKILYSMI